MLTEGEIATLKAVESFCSPVNVEELLQSSLLQVSRPVVYVHLNKFELLMLIKADYKRITGKIGPPYRVFSVSDKGKQLLQLITQVQALLT